VKAGKSADEVVAAAPLAELDAKWGNGMVKSETFLRGVVAGLSRELGLVAPVASPASAAPPTAPTATPAPTPKP